MKRKPTGQECYDAGGKDTAAASSDLACVCTKSLPSCLTLCDPVDYTTRFLCPWDSPGKNTGVDDYTLLQGLFQTKGSNLRLLHLPTPAVLYH